MSQAKIILLAAGACMLAAAPALADKPPDRGPTPGLGWGPGGSKQSYSAPAPVIGAGLPAVLAIGGYLWLRRKRHR
ncbi:hypothetical protein [Mesorhizobium sp. SP-1A]|jgi:LPXTG-motif cell wall-anchored protein|uniref:hypothetical protein n=1 Tax=Mesorhizobium sp. SP-1A TaxID=3077840 RepID=UPI0028F6CD2C|nr:hypothetical protein [Mesorhizobium sp. SP-1A]